MTEWSELRLCEIARVTKGRLNKASGSRCDSRVPYLGAADLAGRTSGVYAYSHNAVMCNRSDVLMLWDGERAGLVGCGLSGAAGSTVARIRTDSTIMIGRYLYHHLRQRFDEIQSLRTGTGVPHVPRDLQDFLKIPTPPLEEQRNIAEILDMLDEAIRFTESVIAKHECIGYGILADLLPGVCRDKSWRTASEPTEADYQKQRLDEIGVVTGGGTPPRERAEYWGGSTPWITPGELTGEIGKYVTTSKEAISGLGLAVSSASVLPRGSLLMTSRASIGFCALAGTPIATNQGFQNLTPHEHVDSSFLLHLGRTLRREMIRRASGTTFLEISGREFGRIEVFLPPLGEQQKIARILDAVDETVQINREQLGKLCETRVGLADDLLSGRVRTTAA